MQQQSNAPVIVQKLEGTVTRVHRRYVKDEELSTPEHKRYRMVEHDEEEPAGYLLMFPNKGHSIRVSEEALKRLSDRFSDPNGFVESESTGNQDMTQILRAAKGGSLVSVNVVDKAGAKK